VNLVTKAEYFSNDWSIKSLFTEITGELILHMSDEPLFNEKYNFRGHYEEEIVKEEEK
jgi:hypothetical protein